MATTLHFKTESGVEQIPLGGVTVSRSVTVLSSDLSAGTAFTVPTYAVGSMKLLVFVNGLLCALGSDQQYVEASTTTIKFNDTLASGTQIAVMVVS